MKAKEAKLVVCNFLGCDERDVDQVIAEVEYAFNKNVSDMDGDELKSLVAELVANNNENL